MSRTQNDISTADAAESSGTMADRADIGYAQMLRPRHIRLIAIGGSIGTGLFLGAGGRLALGGPALALVYATRGLFTFFMMRALGEMAVYRPSSGAFVSYAREFMGEKGAYVTGWLFIRRAGKGLVRRPAFRLFWAPFTNALTIAFLLAIVVGMWFADDIGKPTIVLFLGICAVMVIGWFIVRGRVESTAVSLTATAPAPPETPGASGGPAPR